MLCGGVPDPLLPLELACGLGAFLMPWPWLQGNTVPVLLHFHCTLSDPLQTAPSGDMAPLSLNIRSSSHTANKPQRKSIFFTLSTLIYTTFLTTAPVTNAKRLLNVNVFHRQSPAVWGGGEYMVLSKPAGDNTGWCRAACGAAAVCECMFQRCSP